MKLTHKIPTILIILALLLGGHPAHPIRAAGTWIVTKTADTNDGACNSDCSLREAVAAANLSGDTITFASSLAGSTITLSNQIDINKYLTIDGSNLGSHVRISGEGKVRIFKVPLGIAVSMNHLDIINGKALMGGGISSEGTLTVANSNFFYNNADIGGVIYTYLNSTLNVTNCTFSGNSVTDLGGGIYNSGTLTVENSTFASNSAAYGGGGIYNIGTLTVVNSVFSGNSATYGGGINFDGGTDTIENSTFSNNSATYGGGIYNQSFIIVSNSTFSGNIVIQNGGGIFNTNILMVKNSTLSGNSAASNGGGIYNAYAMTVANGTFSANSATFGGGLYNSVDGSFTLENSILANSTSTYDCLNNGGVPSQNNNLIEANGPAGSACGTPLLTSDPKLDSLASNGGPTQTHALLVGSPAIDAGDDATCELKDQRGVTRPFGTHCDIGAYEFVNQAPTDINLSPSSVNENQPVGTIVGTLSTTDSNLGDSHTYAFCGGADDASFSISGNTLKTATVFDYEIKSGYSACIRSTDSGSLSTTKALVINVNNLIDTQTFEDVPMSYWAWQYIERLYNAGITGGCSTNPLNYCPENQVTRAQMAVFLLKGIHGSSYTPAAVGVDTGFGDVSTTYWASAWIKQLAAEGVTGGCGGGLYCPDSPVTRAQMAVFLLKAKYGNAYIPPVVGADTGFWDVPIDYWAVAWIKQLAAEGITSGCAAGLYCPENVVNRAQMAVFLVKAFNLP